MELKELKMSPNKNSILKLVLSALFLALALVLPLLTGQLKELGNAFCPMHLPVLLCGFFCGPWYALTVGLIAPLLRFAIFGMPPIMPIGIAMCFELAAYGLVSGLLYRLFPKKKPYIYLALIAAMLAGRLVWGAVQVILMGLGKVSFGWTAFLAGAFTNALPGIILQLVLVPLLVMALTKAFPKLSQD